MTFAANAADVAVSHRLSPYFQKLSQQIVTLQTDEDEAEDARRRRGDYYRNLLIGLLGVGGTAIGAYALAKAGVLAGAADAVKGLFGAGREGEGGPSAIARHVRQTATLADQYKTTATLGGATAGAALAAQGTGARGANRTAGVGRLLRDPNLGSATGAPHVRDFNQRAAALLQSVPAERRAALADALTGRRGAGADQVRRGLEVAARTPKLPQGSGELGRALRQQIAAGRDLGPSARRIYGQPALDAEVARIAGKEPVSPAHRAQASRQLMGGLADTMEGASRLRAIPSRRQLGARVARGGIMGALTGAAVPWATRNVMEVAGWGDPLPTPGEAQ